MLAFISLVSLPLDGIAEDITLQSLPLRLF